MNTPPYRARANASDTPSNLTRSGFRIYGTPLERALTFAKLGIPVLPVYSALDEGFHKNGKKRAKTPKTRHGFKDAATDFVQITKWFLDDPEAEVALRTGKESGLLVLDEDRLGALDELTGDLPHSMIVKSPHGRHFYLGLLDDVIINSNVNKPIDGIDIRCEGGYIMAPGSAGYTIINDAPIADAPEQLLDLLTDKKKGDADKPSSNAKTAMIKASEDSIPEGERNTTLTRIAGKLHDGTRSSAELQADLEAVNVARCRPPLQSAETVKIARSIHARPTCRSSAPKVPKAVLKALDMIEVAHLRDGERWKGSAGRSQYSLAVTLLKRARQFGRLTEEGVAVQISAREMACESRVSRLTARRALERLVAAKIVSRVEKGRGTRAGTVQLLTPPSEKLTHLSTVGERQSSGLTSRAPFSIERLRWSKPVFESEGGVRLRAGTVFRLGKTAEMILDFLETRPGDPATIEEIALRLGTKRPRDLRRGNALARLEEAGIVEVVEGTVKLLPKWLSALNSRRESDEEIADHERDKAKYAEESRFHGFQLDVLKLRKVTDDPEEIARRLDVPSAQVRRVLGLPQAPAPVETVDVASAAEPGVCLSRNPSSEEKMEFWADPRKAPHYVDAIEEFARKSKEHRARLATQMEERVSA